MTASCGAAARSTTRALSSASCEAVESLLAEGFAPERTVLLAFGHDEEVGGEQGAVAIAELLASRADVRLESVLDEGGAIVAGRRAGRRDARSR